MQLANSLPGADKAAGQLPNAADEAARLRIGPFKQDEDEQSKAAKLPGDSDDEDDSLNGAQDEAEDGRCKTCEERKYHEMEHVYREQAKAQREGRKVVSQTVTLHNAICPECGKVYISGGTTRTSTMANNRQAEPAEASSGKDNNAA